MIKFNSSGNADNQNNQRFSGQQENQCDVSPVVSDKSKLFRYSGYDNADQFKELLTKLYADAKKDGHLIDRPIANPAPNEIADITECIPQNISSFSNDEVNKIVSALATKGNLHLVNISPVLDCCELSEIICTVLDKLRMTGASVNILKNSLIKFLCWIQRYSTFTITNILYVGNVSKYEFYWLYIMNASGCRVTYVNAEGDDDVASFDREGRFCRTIQGSVFAPLPFRVRDINVEDFMRTQRMHSIMNTPCSLKVEMLSTSYQDVPENIIKSSQQRNGSDNFVPVYVGAFGGVEDEASYKNGLFRLKEVLPKVKKPLILIEKFLPPSYDDTTAYMNISRSNVDVMLSAMADTINIASSSRRTELAKKAFLETMYAQNTVSVQKLFQFGVVILSWLKNITAPIDFNKRDTPVILLYGTVSRDEAVFLLMMAKIGFDVLIFCSDKSISSVLESEQFADFHYTELTHSIPLSPFPKALVKAKISTVAYNAERDLDTMLYNDNTMFRARQFSYCQNATLRTTYDEISIIWHNDSKFRTGFDTQDNLVTVPNIFAKVNGVRYGDVGDYWKNIQSMLTPDTLVYRRLPFFTPYGSDRFGGFFNQDKIDIQRLMRSDINKYSHLSDNVQNLIFNKMQEVIDSGFINVPYPDVVNLTIKTGLSIPTDIQRLIQKFDFTKEVPKIVIVDVVKQTFSVYECILLVMLNLMGFDIIIYTPTGYRNIEQYVSNDAFETHTMDEFIYDLNPPSFKIPKENKKKGGGFFKFR